MRTAHFVARACGLFRGDMRKPGAPSAKNFLVAQRSAVPGGSGAGKGCSVTRKDSDALASITCTATMLGPGRNARIASGDDTTQWPPPEETLENSGPAATPLRRTLPRFTPVKAMTNGSAVTDVISKLARHQPEPFGPSDA